MSKAEGAVRKARIQQKQAMMMNSTPQNVCKTCVDMIETSVKEQSRRSSTASNASTNI
jgi:hypothetical protein